MAYVVVGMGYLFANVIIFCLGKCMYCNVLLPKFCMETYE